MYTEDLSKFGHRERELMAELLAHWNAGVEEEEQ